MNNMSNNSSCGLSSNRTALSIGSIAFDLYFLDDEYLSTFLGGTGYNNGLWFDYFRYSSYLSSTLGDNVPEINQIDLTPSQKVNVSAPRCKIFLNKDTGKERTKWIEGNFSFRNLDPLDEEFDIIYLSSGDECFHDCFQGTAGELKAFNPGPLVAEYDSTKLGAILNEADMVFMNENERRACEYFHSIYPEDSLASFGIEKWFITSENSIQVLTPNDKYIYNIETLAEITDQTGAGDAFSSTYLAKVGRGVDHDEAIEKAVENAKLTIQTMGAVPDKIRE